MSYSEDMGLDEELGWLRGQRSMPVGSTPNDWWSGRLSALEEGMWRAADGRMLKIEFMDDHHVRNCISYLQQHNLQNTGKFGEFVAEFKRRIAQIEALTLQFAPSDSVAEEHRRGAEKALRIASAYGAGPRTLERIKIQMSAQDRARLQKMLDAENVGIDVQKLIDDAMRKLSGVGRSKKTVIDVTKLPKGGPGEKGCRCAKCRKLRADARAYKAAQKGTIKITKRSITAKRGKVKK